MDCESEPQQSGHGDLDDTMGPMADGSDDDYIELGEKEDTWFSSLHHSSHTTVPTPSHDLPETQQLEDSSTSGLELTVYVDKKVVHTVTITHLYVHIQHMHHSCTS